MGSWNHLEKTFSFVLSDLMSFSSCFIRLYWIHLPSYLIWPIPEVTFIHFFNLQCYSCGKIHKKKDFVSLFVLFCVDMWALGVALWQVKQTVKISVSVQRKDRWAWHNTIVDMDKHTYTQKLPHTRTAVWRSGRERASERGREGLKW